MEEKEAEVALQKNTSKSIVSKKSIISKVSKLGTGSKHNVKMVDNIELVYEDRFGEESCEYDYLSNEIELESLMEELSVEFEKLEEMKECSDEECNMTKAQIKEKYITILNKEISALKDKFDLVLQNEQFRCFFLLREAHRERQSKINALKRQLECENLTGLMYLLCNERAREKMEKSKLVEEFSECIDTLLDMLDERQDIIKNLTAKFKCAFDVNEEWKTKMQGIINEFHKFIEHYFGSLPTNSRFYFDMDKMLEVCASLEQDSEEHEELVNDECPKTCPKDCGCDEDGIWWSQLECDQMPFIVFGDLEPVPESKKEMVQDKLEEWKKMPIPENYKTYVFDEKFVNQMCPNLQKIRERYARHVVKPCCKSRKDTSMQTVKETGDLDAKSCMGSMLKMMNNPPVADITLLLGARDSLEIATPQRRSKDNGGTGGYWLKLGKRRVEKTLMETELLSIRGSDSSSVALADTAYEEDLLISPSACRDSILLNKKTITQHEEKIGFEKECPVAECRRIHANRYLNNLPSYLQHTSPFKFYELLFDDYEPCSEEQLKLLMSKFQKSQNKSDEEFTSFLCDANSNASTGKGNQTNPMTVSCDCTSSSELLDDSILQDIPVCKPQWDCITKSKLFNEDINFNRFNVVGEKDADHIPAAEVDPQTFTQERLVAMREILKRHPSLCSMFLTPVKC